MIKILQFAAVIVAALWFTSDAFAHENKHSSNFEEFDFYLDDESLNETTQHGNPLKTETTEFNKNDEPKESKNQSIDKPHSEDANDYYSVGNLKRLIRYFVSLLHSINEDNSHDEELLQDHKYGKEPFPINTTLKTNQTGSTSRINKSSDTENIGDAEFENSGGGNGSEYYEEGNSFKNSYKEESGINTLKPNIKMKPRARNHGRISGGQQRNSDDNQKLTSEDFGFDKHRANPSASRTGQVSDEFIDEYINSSTDTESENDTDIPSDQHSAKHPKLEEKEHREFSSASQESKVQTDSDTNSVSTEPSDSDADHCTENDTDIPSDQHSAKHPKLEEKENREFPSASQESEVQTDSDTDSVSSEPSDSDADHCTENDTDIPSDQHSVKHTALEEKENQEFSSASQESEVHTDSDTDSVSNEPSDSDADHCTEKDTDIPSDQHSVKHPALEEKENQEFSGASEESKEQTDSDTDSDSSEYSDSEEFYDYYEYDDEDLQLMSNDMTIYFANYFTEIFSNDTTQSSENFTEPFANYSMEIESPASSRNNSKINTIHKTQGLYNSIVEFLYKHSNNTWIKNLREENRQM